MFSSIRSRNLSCESEAKFILDRIAAVERTVAELSHTFGDYARKIASIRDKGDDIGKAILVFADGETINKNLSDATANFATCMSTIGGYGNLRINTINKKVINELREYEVICKRAKDEVRGIYAVREKEITRKKTLDRLKERDPRNRHHVLQAESELVKASSEVARTIHNLEDQIVTFERQKIVDLKAILLNFISGEMGFHARAIEVLTKAYKHIDDVNEEADLEEFKQSLHFAETLPTAEKRSTFHQSQSLGSLNTLPTGKQLIKRTSRNSPGITRHNLGIPKSGRDRMTGIQRARSEEDLENAVRAQKGFYYDSESVSETDTAQKRPGRIDATPFLAKHYTK